ncbi:hypothetical protein BpHYR1_022022 [Brachionus plicatilis]|uniref:Uncharacterized protein n=1 Tax=Brachionus plicatilis TaxID=10195 RepID=A0A3M7PMN5_BRAPC|nr:hypothetical protein BpHYR1_022022 [Brachionus plicatilis]
MDQEIVYRYDCSELWLNKFPLGFDFFVVFGEAISIGKKIFIQFGKMCHILLRLLNLDGYKMPSKIRQNKIQFGENLNLKKKIKFLRKFGLVVAKIENKLKR